MTQSTILLILWLFLAPHGQNSLCKPLPGTVTHYSQSLPTLSAAFQAIQSEIGVSPNLNLALLTRSACTALGGENGTGERPATFQTRNNGTDLPVSCTMDAPVVSRDAGTFRPTQSTERPRTVASVTSHSPDTARWLWQSLFTRSGSISTSNSTTALDAQLRF